MSIANWVPYSRRKAVSQRLLTAKEAKRMMREPDYETLHRRSLYDARGRILREGRTYCAASVTHWIVRRSQTGRVNQRDVLVDGRLWSICGPRRLPAWLR